MEQLLVHWQHRLSHNSLAWRGTRKVLTASWLWLVWPEAMGTYLWLPCVLWWRLSTRSSWSLAATVAGSLGVHASCRLTIHVFSNNSFHSHFFGIFFFFFNSQFHRLMPSLTFPRPHTLTLQSCGETVGDSECPCATMSSVLSLEANQQSCWRAVIISLSLLNVFHGLKVKCVVFLRQWRCRLKTSYGATP